jgi:hypothetical protein
VKESKFKISESALEYYRKIEYHNLKIDGNVSSCVEPSFETFVETIDKRIEGLRTKYGKIKNSRVELLQEIQLTCQDSYLPKYMSEFFCTFSMYSLEFLDKIYKNTKHDIETTKDIIIKGDSNLWSKLKPELGHPSRKKDLDSLVQQKKLQNLDVSSRIDSITKSHIFTNFDSERNTIETILSSAKKIIIQKWPFRIKTEKKPQIRIRDLLLSRKNTTTTNKNSTEITDTKTHEIHKTLDEKSRQLMEKFQNTSKQYQDECSELVKGVLKTEEESEIMWNKSIMDINKLY